MGSVAVHEAKGALCVRIKAACHGCKYLHKVYGNKDKQGNMVASGYWCIARNGRIKAHPVRCGMRQEKGDNK